MDSKRWLACFLATVLLLGAAVVGFNYWVDPFGVFSHKSLEWPSYEMTINPRTAKITYLKDHHQDYDSYILGCSSTSSFPVESLNSYLDADDFRYDQHGGCCWCLHGYDCHLDPLWQTGCFHDLERRLGWFSRHYGWLRCCQRYRCLHHWRHFRGCHHFPHRIHRPEIENR